MYCKECGAYNQDDSTTCVSCGATLTKTAANSTTGMNQTNIPNTTNQNGTVNINKNMNTQSNNFYNQQDQNTYAAQGYNCNGYQNGNPYQNNGGYQNNYNPNPPYGYAQQNTYINNPNVIPGQYRPISAWGYVGYMLLFAIPLVGFIVALVFAFGSNMNVNVKNYARAYLILIVIGFILGLLIALLFREYFIDMLHHARRYYYY